MLSARLFVSDRAAAPRVFDGVELHEGWVVRIVATASTLSGRRTVAAAGTNDRPAGCDLTPGLIESIPTSCRTVREALWNDQVLREGWRYAHPRREPSAPDAERRLHDGPRSGTGARVTLMELRCRRGHRA
jgi:hypothetical protein